MYPFQLQISINTISSFQRHFLRFLLLFQCISLFPLTLNLLDSPIIINFHLPMHWCGGVSNSKGENVCVLFSSSTYLIIFYKIKNWIVYSFTDHFRLITILSFQFQFQLICSSISAFVCQSCKGEKVRFFIFFVYQSHLFYKVEN